MQKPVTKLFSILFLAAMHLQGQDPGIDNRLNNGELQMTFPSIYFKHKSRDYAVMPYTVDSCFKYIVANINHIKGYSIWRDSSETEQLTIQRIEKIRADLNKYKPGRKINIRTMDKAQKISQHSIYSGKDDKQVQYLLTLNSVLDIYATRALTEKKGRKKITHQMIPRPWCLGCWQHGFFIKYRRDMRKAKKAEKASR